MTFTRDKRGEEKRRWVGGIAVAIAMVPGCGFVERLLEAKEDEQDRAEEASDPQGADDSVKRDDDRGARGPGKSGGGPAGGATAPERPGDSYNPLVDPKDAIARFGGKLGAGAMVMQMNFHASPSPEHIPGWIDAQFQDPGTPRNVDEYKFNGASIEGPTPVKLIVMGSGSKEEAIEAGRFALTSVDLSVLPTIAKDCLRQTGIEDGKVSHANLERPLPFHKEVRYRVFVRGVRDDGSCQYDLKGTFLEKSLH